MVMVTDRSDIGPTSDADENQDLPVPILTGGLSAAAAAAARLLLA